MIEFDKDLLSKLFEQAAGNPHRQQNYDLRTSEKSNCLRELKALLPGTVVPIRQYKNSTETIICLCGKLDEIIYEEVVSYKKPSSEDFKHGMDAQDIARKVEYREVKRIHLCPTQAKYGCQIPKGTWHALEVIEPSVIFEAMDDNSGEEGSETMR